MMVHHGFRIGLALVLLLLFNAIPTAPATDPEIVPQEPNDTRGTIVVNASGGGDYTHIQWAIDNASAGDTVYVEAGIYNETIEIAKGITLTGESRDRTTITGEGRLINVSANDVTVSGFTVTGSTVPYEGIGIYLENVKNCNVSGNNCSNNSYFGIQIVECTQVIISNNNCSWIGVDDWPVPYFGNGIIIMNSKEIVITNNYCSNNTYYGINIENTSSSIIENNICNNHDEYYIYGIGIRMNQSDRNVIGSNNCTKNGDGIKLEESNDNIIEKNHLFLNFEAGIILLESKNNQLNENDCFSTGSGSGIYLGSSNSNLLFGNYLLRNDVGFYLSNSKYNIIDNNEIVDNINGIALHESSDKNRIICNSLVNNSDLYTGYGIDIGGLWDEYPPINNMIHHNNLINNTKHNGYQASDYRGNNFWNDSLEEGNYWSNYLTRYPDAESDGNVWNQPYELDGFGCSKDLYPLVNPVEQGTYYPVAIVDSPIEIDQHETITLDGECCYDHLGIVNYTWDLDDNGEHIRLFGISPKYTFHDAGTYTVRLTVTNTQGNRDRATSTITVRDTEPPIANAGPDASIELYQTYRFDGSASRDNVDIVNYTWFFGYGAGWRNLYGVSPHFTFDIAGNFQVTLWVYDANGNYARDLFLLTVWDSTRPTADAGYDMFVDQNEMVVFNGSRSMDNVGIADYTWRFKDGDTPVILNGETCSFVFHNVGKYAVTLNVSDDEGNWDTDDLAVTVMDIEPPVADAGSNITTFQDTLVTFNGTNSTDNTGLVNYTWTFKYNHRKVFLYGSAPNFFFALPGLYDITLEVWDMRYNSNKDRMWIDVIDNERPQVDAGKDTTIYGNGSIRFDGSHCTDNVGIANYTWIIEYGGKIFTLYGPYPDFRFPDYGIYKITLYVTDHEGNVGNDTFNITVIEIPEMIVNDDSDNNIGDMDPEDDREPIIEEFDFEIIIWMGTLMVIFIVAVIGLLLYFLRNKDPDPVEQCSEDEMGRVVNDDGNGNGNDE